jgi:site-specific recombinase XerD
MHILFQRYLTRLTAKGNTPEASRANTTNIGRFASWCSSQGINPDDLTIDQAQDYTNLLVGQVSLRTAKLHVTQISGAYRYACDLGLRGGNPWPRARSRPPRPVLKG